MNQAELTRRLQGAGPGSEQAVTLVRELLEDTRYPARLAINHYLAASDALAVAKGMDVLTDMRELSLAALAESPSLPDVASEVWVIRTMSDALLEFRREAASTLKELLGCRGIVPRLPPGGDPDLPRDSRVCDLAFVLLRRMLRMGTSSHSFLEGTVDQRNRQIEDLQKSPSFRSFFDNQS
jgi:hypothetical protein